tara:strand:- start:1343 stop:1651 length:309 start_codon:yes stop_codon:yes gene_type:complete
MAAGLFKISSATTTVLTAKEKTKGNIRSINIANIHASNPVYISLYLDDDTNQTYYFKKNILWPGERMLLDKGLGFNNRALGLKLTTEAPAASSSVSVDVIIK